MTKTDNNSANPPEQPLPADLLAEYERRLSELEQEISLRRSLNLEQQAELAALGTRYQQELADLHRRLKEETEEKQRQLETRLNDQRMLFETTLTHQKNLLSSNLAEQRSQLENSLAEQRNQFEAQLAEQRSLYEARLAEQHSQDEARVVELEQQFRTSLDDLDRQTRLRLAERDALILARSAEIAALNGAVSSLRSERDAILNSTSWRFIIRVQRFRERIIPIGSRREKLMRILLGQGRTAVPAQPQPISSEQPPAPQPASTTSSPPLVIAQPEQPSPQVEQTAPPPVEEVRPQPPVPQDLSTPISVEEVNLAYLPPPHSGDVEIVVRVSRPATPHVVRNCLAALLEHTPAPYHLTIHAQDTSPETNAYLIEFIRQYEARAVSSAETSMLQTSCELLAEITAPPGTAEWIVLLDAAAQVTPGWLERLLTCAQSDAHNGMVGPLTNASGLQSIALSGSDLAWAGSPLPAGISPDQVSAELAATSTRVYPHLPRLEHFCLLLRRAMLAEIGWLDPAAAALDYSQRATAAGWQLALADDTYVYLQPTTLPVEIRDDSSAISREQERVLQGIRARADHLLERHALVQRAAASYAGKRILFILPMAAAGGGANAILLATRTLRRMNLEAHIYNLPAYRAAFEHSYPSLDIPLVYGEITDLPQVASRYDAVVATSYITVYWAAQVAASHLNIPIAYYIQDYEPYFDEPGSEGYARAEASYTLLPNLIRGCTTTWIQDTIQRCHHVDTTLLGPSLDIDLYLPRPRQWQTGQGLRVAAMVRPSTPRRNPRVTMEILRRASREFGDALELVIFGADLAELRQAGMPLDFPFTLAGRLTPPQVARLMNEIDIFLDYSIFQGLGLSALEAMGCGAATVVPKYGGTDSYARHEENCLVIDTQDDAVCYAALKRLVLDADLRLKLGRNGIPTIAQFSAELPTFRLLQKMFPDK